MFTVCRYLDNIITHPDEEKYRKIRASNKVFQEKVCSVMGSVLFLEAVGFEQHNLSQGKVLLFLPHPPPFLLATYTYISTMILKKGAYTCTCRSVHGY